jgi:hypothetical protein
VAATDNFCAGCGKPQGRALAFVVASPAIEDSSHAEATSLQESRKRRGSLRTFKPTWAYSKDWQGTCPACSRTYGPKEIACPLCSNHTITARLLPTTNPRLGDQLEIELRCDKCGLLHMTAFPCKPPCSGLIGAHNLVAWFPITNNFWGSLCAPVAVITFIASVAGLFVGAFFLLPLWYVAWYIVAKHVLPIEYIGLAFDKPYPRFDLLGTLHYAYGNRYIINEEAPPQPPPSALSKAFPP